MFNRLRRPQAAPLLEGHTWHTLTTRWVLGAIEFSYEEQVRKLTAAYDAHRQWRARWFRTVYRSATASAALSVLRFYPLDVGTVASPYWLLVAELRTALLSSATSRCRQRLPVDVARLVDTTGRVLRDEYIRTADRPAFSREAEFAADDYVGVATQLGRYPRRLLYAPTEPVAIVLALRDSIPRRFRLTGETVARRIPDPKAILIPPQADQPPRSSPRSPSEVEGESPQAV